MTARSYPAVGVGGFNDVLWRAAYFDVNGIIGDYYGAAGKLQRIDTTNTARLLGPVKVAVSGYVFEILDGDYEEVVVPPVASGAAVNYYIAIQYNPALNVADSTGDASALGPCRLICSAGAPSNSGNKTSVLLWTVTRSPAQVLTAGVLTDYRRWWGPNITFGYLYPSTGGYGNWTRGTRAYESSTDTHYIREYSPSTDGLYWLNESLPDYVDFGFASGLKAADTPPQWFIQNNIIKMRGTLCRTNGANLNTGADVILGQFGVGHRPTYLERFPCAGTGGVIKVVQVNAAGQVVMKEGVYTNDHDISYIDLSNISFQARQ